MIDFHNHILPKIDDGSDSIETSISMLKNAANQGITDVVNTVHYQHPKVSGLDISYSLIKKETNMLQAILNDLGLPINLHIGAEVFYLPNLLEIKDDPLITFGHGKYMLIEFQPHNIPDTHKKVFFDLKMSGVTPIIAHPERYKSVQKDQSKVQNWLDAGCLIQVDAGSILGLFGKTVQDSAKKIINSYQCQIIGSDAHDDKKRNFILSDAIEIVKKWIGNEALELVYDNPKRILSGEKVPTIEHDNKIDNHSNFWNKLLPNRKR